MCITIPAASCGHYLNTRLQKRWKECFLFTQLAAMSKFVEVMSSICMRTMIKSIIAIASTELLYWGGEKATKLTSVNKYKGREIIALK